MHDDRRLAGLLAILGAAAAFGTLGIVTRYAYDAGLDTVALGGWRAAIGSLSLWAVIGGRAVATGRPIVPPGITRRELLTVVAMTICGLLVNVGLLTAFGLMTIALVLLGFYTYPALIAVAGALFLGEPLDRRRLTALALAVGGMVLVVLGGLDPTGAVTIDPLGLVLSVGAGAAQASFVLLTRGGFRHMPSEHATAGVLGGIALIFLATGAATGGLATFGIPLADPAALATVAWAGTVTAALSTFLFVTGIRLIGPLRAGIGSLFEPVVGAVLAGLLLGEAITILQAVGGALILGAAALLQRGGAAGGTAAGADRSADRDPVDTRVEEPLAPLA